MLLKVVHQLRTNRTPATAKSALNGRTRGSGNSRRSDHSAARVSDNRTDQSAKSTKAPSSYTFNALKQKAQEAKRRRTMQAGKNKNNHRKTAANTRRTRVGGGNNCTNRIKRRRETRRDRRNENSGAEVKLGKKEKSNAKVQKTQKDVATEAATNRTTTAIF